MSSTYPTWGTVLFDVLILVRFTSKLPETLMNNEQSPGKGGVATHNSIGMLTTFEVVWCVNMIDE